MKEISKFKCEVCGTLYDDRQLANQCEHSHDMIVSVENSFYNVGDVVPLRITVRTRDGSTVSYRKE